MKTLVKVIDELPREQHRCDTPLDPHEPPPLPHVPLNRVALEFTHWSSKTLTTALIVKINKNERKIKRMHQL